MFKIKEYLVAKTLDEAYEALQAKKANVILGGTLWLKLGNRNIHTAIDLSSLGLDKIEEEEDCFKIGCMTTLRDLETNKAINEYFDDSIKKSVESIVGTQFRNGATIGGSIYSRFGFSDILTSLMAFDTYVELYKGGLISLEDFSKMPYEKDIIVRIIIRKNKSRASYLSHRQSATDLPVLTVAVAKTNENFKIVVGSRPGRAMVAIEASKMLVDDMSEEGILKAAEKVSSELSFDSNCRGSKEYRGILAKALVKRAIKEVVGGSTYER